MIHGLAFVLRHMKSHIKEEYIDKDKMDDMALLMQYFRVGHLFHTPVSLGRCSRHYILLPKHTSHEAVDVVYPDDVFIGLKQRWKFIKEKSKIYKLAFFFLVKRVVSYLLVVEILVS